MQNYFELSRRKDSFFYLCVLGKTRGEQKHWSFVAFLQFKVHFLHKKRIFSALLM